MENKVRYILSVLIRCSINFLFGGCVLFVLYAVMQLFCFSSFKIPSDSMNPELITGDNVLVAKPILGARVFNVFSSLRGEQTEIWRMPGFREIKRNDVLVFNFPHPNDWGKIEMHIMKYYIKRCIAIPGDIISISKGYYKIAGVDANVGNMKSQERLSERHSKDIEKNVFFTFPFDSILHWNIKEFGPLFVPKRGDIINLNRTSAVLYKKIIEWEQKGTVSIVDGIVLLNGSPIRRYEFKKNYYFMAGDRVEDSQDSRYWGLLPEEYIVGKAWVIWKSVDKYTGAYRWNRFFKRIN